MARTEDVLSRPYFSWAQLFTGLGVLLGGGWVVLTFTLSSLEARVGSIDESLKTVTATATGSQASLASLAERVNGLDRSAQSLDEGVKALNAKAEGIQGGLAGLGKELSAVSTKLDTAIEDNKAWQALAMDRLRYLTPNYRRVEPEPFN
jgi:hypothetical protein